MKTKIKTISLFIIAISYVVFLSSCQKDKPCTQGTTTYNLLSDEKAKIPYSGKDTLTFVRTTIGDTFTFYSTGWQGGYNTSYTANDCPQKEMRESRILIFQSLSFSKPIIINQYIPDNDNYASILSIGFQNINYLCSSGSIGTNYSLDSVIIQTKTYYHINVFSDLDFSIPKTYKCYFSLQYGILKLILANGETWELVPKK